MGRGGGVREVQGSELAPSLWTAGKDLPHRQAQPGTKVEVWKLFSEGLSPGQGERRVRRSCIGEVFSHHHLQAPCSGEEMAEGTLVLTAT